jgi:hypothetical protein
MSGLEIALAVVVLLVGIPSFVWVWRSHDRWLVEWRNPTAGALVLCWAFGQVMFYVFGVDLLAEDNRSLLVYCDFFVIAIIIAKPEVCSLRPYHGFWHEIGCMFQERSRWDRAVFVLFLVAWVAYAAPLSERGRWMALWAIAVLQFAAAAGETITKWRTARTANAGSEVPERHPSAGLEFARPAWVRGYG